MLFAFEREGGFELFALAAICLLFDFLGLLP
jgi:hypothetical protein